jgi:serine/threonine protein kinase
MANDLGNPADRRAPTPDTAPTAANHGGASSSVLGAIASGPDGDFETHPKQIGHYKIIRKLGKGGMGVVLLGVRDDDQFHKRVAIKIIRRGIDSASDGKEVLKRFDLERQVLGALNHPNIARLLDAGQLPEPDGRPYFVMEYVEGEPIDEYCDRMQLTTEQRLELFRKVCAAVHHAHQNLVVHRDIKPGNVLVDVNNEPKLMDFGIAKLLNPAMAAVTLATSWDRGPMTPEYASPEQIQGKPVSTASDVYALGVLMYELLTGRRPYRLKSRIQSAIEDAILNQEPERPSTIVTQEVTLETDGQTRTVTAEAFAKPREGAVTRLKRKLAGDVDNIVLMAMRKSPQRRYPSAEALAADIQRHLEGEPVQAAPDSVIYRAGKFVKRNRAGVLAAALVLLAIVGGGVASFVGWRAAAQARDAERAAKEQEARIAQENLEIAGTYFRALDDAVRKLEGTTDARQQLARAALSQLESLRKSRPEDPSLLVQLARNYALISDLLGGVRGGNRGEAVKAREPLEQSLEIARNLVKTSPSVENKTLLAADLIRLGDLRTNLPDLGDPIDAYNESVHMVAGPDEKEPTEPDLQRLFAQGLLNRADIRARTEAPGDSELAEKDYRRSLDIRERRLADQPEDIERQRDLTVGLSHLASLVSVKPDGRDEAYKLFKRALDIRERTLKKDPNARTKHDVLLAAGALGRMFVQSDSPSADGAAPYFAREYELAQDLLKTDSNSIRADGAMTWAAIDMGTAATLRGDNKKAERFHAEAVRHARIVFERDPNMRARWNLARALSAHAMNLEQLDRRDEALKDLDEAKPLWTALAQSPRPSPVYAEGLKACEDSLDRLSRP